MEKVNLSINNIMKFLKFILFKLYNKIIFLSNKQLTIKKMYEPIIENKTKENEDLNTILKKFKNENNEILKAIRTLDTDNKALNLKINTLSEYLIKK